MGKLMLKKVISVGLTVPTALCAFAGTGGMLVNAEESSKTVILSENFDDYQSTGELKGYTFGNPTLSLVDEGEGKALLVSDRTSNYYSYAIDVASMAGNKINLSYDAKTVEAEETQSVNATIKTTKDGSDSYDYVTGGEVNNDSFTTITGSYEIPSDAESYVIYFETTENVSYEIDNIEFSVEGEYVAPSEEEKQTSYVDISEYPVLKDLYKDYFKMGVACESISNWNNELSEIGNPNKEALIKQEFNSITFGNELKPAYNMGYKSPDATEEYLPFVITPAAKEMLDWAKSNDIAVRGHVLVWHSQCADEAFCKNYTPVYLSDGKTLDPSCYVDKDTMLKRMESYIYSTMEYMYANGYGQTIYTWDVVNEAVEPGTNADNLRNSYWYQIIGSEFIFDAFKYAREAEQKYSKQYAGLYGVDPEDEAAVKALQPALYYNDYNEFQASKRDAIIKNLLPVKEAGYIDGIGMQAHLSDTSNLDDFMTALNMYNENFGAVQITELDVAETSTGVNADYYQAMFYNKLFTNLIEAKKAGANITAVTIWGLTDDNSWKKESSPLVFEGDLSTKLAFTGIVNAATGEAMPEATYEAPNFKDLKEDLEGETNGFTVRGSGTLTVESDEVHTGKAALLDSDRTATWNGVSFDVSRFVGQTIAVSAWVKSEAKTVKVSADIDGSWPNIATATSKGEWVQLYGTYSIPKDLTALKLYIEAEDLSDIYVDDVEVRLVGLDENFEGSTNIASPRGVGHMPVCSVVADAGRSGKGLLVKREEQDATMKFDISKYVGQDVEITAYVKTADSKISMGFDGATPVELTSVASKSGEFTKISAKYSVPNDITSAAMYIETDGKADFYVDDISLRVADFTDDVENGLNFTARWSGAGTAKVVEEADGNHTACLTDRTASYYGLCFDMTKYLGMQVEISFDVKTDDSTVKLSGDIDGSWPNYMSQSVNPGQYNTISCLVNLPSDLSALRMYIETDGTSDIYVDNLKVSRVALGKQFKVSYEDNSFVANEGSLLPIIAAPESEEVFSGWYTDEACTTPWNFASDRVTADMTLFPGFEKKHEHSYTANVVAPTCTEDGYTTYTCQCGDTYTADIVKATGHIEGDPVEENRKEATYTQAGSYEKATYCKNCGQEMRRYTVEIPRKNIVNEIRNSISEIVKKVKDLFRNIFKRP